MLISQIITGEKVTLRPFEEGDIAYWDTWDVDVEVQEFMPEPHCRHVEYSDHLEYFAESMASIEEIHATIVLNESNKPVGTISITEISRYHGVGELGVVIGDKEQWGKGVASEAIGLFMKSLKGELRRVSAEFEADNIAMEKVLEKNGFELEAVCKRARIKDGVEIDTKRMILFLK